MSQAVLPSSINYDQQLASLMPGVNNFSQTLTPINGTSFTQNTQIIVDLPSRAFIDPKSVYIRYKAVATTTTQGGVIGCPVYTPFTRVDTYINSQLIESVFDYNLVAHVWTNLNLSVADKYGNQAGFGYIDSTPATVDMSELDGRFLSSTTGETYYVSAPLICTMLTSSEKFIPAFATGGIRLVFTLDSNSNMFSNGAGASTMTISNFEVCYDLVDFGSMVEQEILSRDNITIKSNGYNASSVAGPTSTGNFTLVYNQRLASIRSALVCPNATAVNANYINGKFDSVDVTTAGSYQLNIGGNVYPQGAPLSTGNNKSGILSELRKAVGNLYDWSKSMSINSVEFSYVDNPTPTTSLTQPGKFYVGFDLNKINSSSNMMLNGTSTQNSPINLNLSITSTPSAKNILLILNYDAIINIDPRTKQVNILQ